MKKNYYTLLGISSDASQEDIRRAYRALAKEFHPDRMGPSGKRKFQEIQEAYEMLNDPQKRAEYDSGLKSKIHRKIRRQKPEDPIHANDEPDRRMHRDVEPLRPQSGSRIEKYVGSTEPPDVTTIEIPRENVETGIIIIMKIPAVERKTTAWGAEEVIQRKRRISVHVPPGFQDGDMFRVSLPFDESPVKYFRIRIKA